MEEKILDERDYSDNDKIRQETLNLRHQRLLRQLSIFTTLFACCYGIVITLAYATTVREAARIFGLTDPDTIRGVFLTIFIASLGGYVGSIITWFRCELHPYPLAWPISACRAALRKRASRYGFAAAALIALPLLIYLNFTMRQFGSVIGIRPSPQSGGTSEVLMVTCMLTGFFAFIICIMHNYRAPNYKHPAD